MTLEIKTVEHHRNGICGMPFDVVTFQWDGRNMMAVRFDDSNIMNPRIAVFDMDLVGKGDVRFGMNSWRGDQFSYEVDQAIKERWAK